MRLHPFPEARLNQGPRAEGLNNPAPGPRGPPWGRSSAQLRHRSAPRHHAQPPYLPAWAGSADKACQRPLRQWVWPPDAAVPRRGAGPGGQGVGPTQPALCHAGGRPGEPGVRGAHSLVCCLRLRCVPSQAAMPACWVSGAAQQLRLAMRAAPPPPLVPGGQGVEPGGGRRLHRVQRRRHPGSAGLMSRPAQQPIC